MEIIKKIIDKILAVLLGVMLFSMVAVAAWGIFTRVVLRNQASFTTEFTGYVLLWVSLLSAAYVFGEKGHLSITFIKDKFNEKITFYVDILTQFIIMFFAISVLIYGGYRGVMMGMNEMSPSLNISIGYIYMAMPISGLFISFYSLYHLVEMISRPRKYQEQEDVEIL